jgi:uncharacterized membrane protein YccC
MTETTGLWYALRATLAIAVLVWVCFWLADKRSK